MTTEKLNITLSPISLYHLNAYLSGLRINEVKSAEQLAAIAETLDALSEIIGKAREMQEKNLVDVKKK